MKAWQITRNGDPAEVLELAELPRPTPGHGQLLVRVLAAAANFPDVLMCQGTYQVRPPLPFTPGVELCGEVVESNGDEFGAGGERQRRAYLVGALAHQHVGEVGDGGEDPDQELPRARGRGGDLGQFQDVDRVAVAGDLPGFHAVSFSSIRRCSRFMPRSHLSVSVARSA